ncbi:MAG: YbfB/YjiJ family MFS transporter [Alphaproteobacteria bacterium]
MTPRTAGRGSERGRAMRAAAAGLAALFVGVGLARFAYTPLIPALIAAAWFTPPQAAYLAATNLAGYFLGALFAVGIARHMGVSTAVRAAMAAAVASFVACAWPSSFLWFVPWRLLSGISGGVVMVLVTTSVLARTPPAWRGRVGGIVFTGVGLGITAAGTIVPALAEDGLTAGWLALGLVALLLTAVTWRSWPDEPPPAAEVALGAATAALPLRPVVLLTMLYVCDAIGFVPHSVFWIDYIARGLGRGLAVGGLYWVAFGLGAAIGPLLAGFLADRAGMARSLVLVLLVKGLAVALPIIADDGLSLAVSSLVVGALTPGVPAIISARVIDLVTPAHARRVWAWLTIAFAVAQTIAGYGLSFLFALTGSYRLLFAVGALSMALATLLASASMGRTRR